MMHADMWKKVEMLKNAVSHNILKYIGIQILLLSMISCGSASNENSEFPPVEFNVNLDLLSSPLLIDTSFWIQMPSDWPEVDSETFDTAKRAIDNDTLSFFRLKLLRAFKSEKGASCVISKVVDQTPTFDLLNKEFEDILKSSFQTEDVVKGTFRVKGNNVIQYRIIAKPIIAFKLFFQIEGNFYQIDYFIPASLYYAEIRKVESSIGSLASEKERKEMMEKEEDIQERKGSAKESKGG
ncbi:MAG: hypothetical protein WBD28_07920 [Candidatus Zixiibacteriota bacterium]